MGDVWKMKILESKSLSFHYTFKNKTKSAKESQFLQLHAITPWRTGTTTTHSGTHALRNSPSFWQQAVSSSHTCEISSSGMTDAGITGCG